ncbi:hypothetical protein [Rhodanobacter lindaniclasticus]
MSRLLRGGWGEGLRQQALRQAFDLGELGGGGGVDGGGFGELGFETVDEAALFIDGWRTEVEGLKCRHINRLVCGARSQLAQFLPRADRACIRNSGSSASPHTQLAKSGWSPSAPP